MMKPRMAAPEHLIDLRGAAQLKGIAREEDAISVGARVTQRELIASARPAEASPILREAALQIPDPRVRSMGTVGGDVASGDPGDDMLALTPCLDARLELAGPDGADGPGAGVPPRGLRDGARAGEIFTCALIPVPRAAHDYAYEKQKRKIGDYATAAAVVLSLEGGRRAAASVAMTNLAVRPIRAEDAGGGAGRLHPRRARGRRGGGGDAGGVEPVKDNPGAGRR